MRGAVLLGNLDWFLRCLQKVYYSLGQCFSWSTMKYKNIYFALWDYLLEYRCALAVLEVFDCFPTTGSDCTLPSVRSVEQTQTQCLQLSLLPKSVCERNMEKPREYCRNLNIIFGGGLIINTLLECNLFTVSTQILAP